MKKLKFFLGVCTLAGAAQLLLCLPTKADFFLARPFISRGFYYRSNQVAPPVYWNANPNSGYSWSTNPSPAYNSGWNTNPYPAYNYPYGNANPYPVYNYVIPYEQGSYPSAYPYSPAFNPSLYSVPSSGPTSGY